MLAITLLAMSVANFECTMRSNLSVLEAELWDEQKRQKALREIVAVHGIGDSRLSEHYRKAIDAFSRKLAGRTVIVEICSDQFYNDRTFMLLIERCERDPHEMLGYLQYMYRIRSHWHGNHLVISKLEALAKSCFSNRVNASRTIVWMKKSSEINIDSLNEWTGMCRTFAMIGTASIEPICLDALMDKRQCQLADVPQDFPAAARPCDHALIALLLLKGIDVPTVFEEYGFRQLPLQGFHSKNCKMFDKMISDYSYILRKYSPKTEPDQKRK